MLSVIVTIHEFGHYIASKAFNVYVSEFSIGMGKALYQKKGKETTFSIRMLPIGGYCAIASEEDGKVITTDGEFDTTQIPKERCINHLAPLKRIIVYSAGVIMNFLLAFITVSMVYLGVGQAAVSGDATITSVETNYPAAEAGLEAGDKITYISLDNGYSSTIDSYSEVSNFLSMYEGEGNVYLTVLRNGQKKTIAVKPVEEDGRYVIGITFSRYSIVETNIFNCWKYGFIYIKEIILLLFTTIIGLFRGVGYDNLGGIVGTYELTDEVVSYGFSSYLSLVALISLNVGMINLVPLPVFDGGKILLTLIEIIIRKPIDKKFEQTITNVSMVILLALFIFVTAQDIIKLF